MNQGGALGEEPHRLAREGEGWHAPGHLARNPKSLLAGRKHAQRTPGTEDVFDQPGAGVDQVLAAVQQQERLAVSQMPTQ